VVLDDAFQHRRAARVADVVLVSADAWTGATRLLPAGPFREPLRALRRASVVVITVKQASTAQVAAVEEAVRAVAPAVPRAVIALVADRLHQLPVEGSAVDVGVPSATRPLDSLAGRAVLAVSAIGDPAPFEAALVNAGAQVRGRRFADHHAFTAAEAEALARDVPAGALAVCTLKDAVKLAPLWPRLAPPLWYVSQAIVVRRGAEALDGAVGRVLAAREAPSRTTRPTAG
jgi:tetraacyldisaccharide 4'-kinase